MILKTLYVKLEDAHSTHDEAYAFLKASRFVCNFLEREVLRPLRYRCAGFNRVVVVAKENPADGVFVNSSQVAVVECPLDRGALATGPGGGSAEYYVGLLRDGLAKCAAQVDIPQQELLRGINDFVAGGMKNTWLFKSRTFRDAKMKASLFCELTAIDFRLRLQVWRLKALIVDEVVLVTDPDEVAFHYRFDDIRIVDGSLTVTNRYGVPAVWSKSMADLAALQADLQSEKRTES